MFEYLTYDEMMSVEGGGWIRELGHDVIRLICAIFF